METLSFQAPAAMKKKLERFAGQLDRSKGYLIREALADYLEDLEDYVAVMRDRKSHDPKRNLSLAAVKRKYKLK
ncbi:MAG: ribbon-helix-helix domain-containing protein [Alphaproteobacteria bacterium]|nr:ribbon-helix-helix domain-containing protein [Alphaproteobacteria bacterium]